MTSSANKTIVFAPLNSPGHINSSLGIADRIKDSYGWRTVFLVVGSTIGTAIQDHGHELVTIPESSPYEDYPISDDEDLLQPCDEARKRAAGKQKKQFEGAFKWPQIISRQMAAIALEPVEAFIASCKILEEVMIGELRANHDAIERALEQLKPDLIVIDAYYVPPCIVKLTHIPWVRLYSANPIQLAESKLPGGLKPPPMCGFSLLTKEARNELRKQDPTKLEAMMADWKHALDRMMPALAGVGHYLADFFQSKGAQPPPPGKQAHDSPHLNVYMYPAAIDYDQDDDLFEYPKRWFRCDSLLRKPIIGGSSGEGREFWDKKLADAKRGKDNVIFFSLGSIASGNMTWMRKFVDILKHDKRRLYVVSKGVNGDRFELDPDNMIGGNYIPQTHFLAQADLAIIHGGNNSVTECLYFGVPMIVLPVFADQIDNAQRIEDFGLGKRLNVNSCTKDELMQAIESVLTHRDIQRRANELGRRMRASDDLASVTKLLKRLLDNGKLEQEFIDSCRGDS